MLSWDELHRRIVECRACPRLVSYRTAVARQKKREFADWEYWGRPVPGFGDRDARLLIIGLAPAAHGANRTGRMFTGDPSARFLVAALHRAGLASQPTSERRDDGLRLVDAFMTAPVRCAPPDNRPRADEMARCFPYLQAEMALLPRVRVILALGRIAFEVSRRLLAPRLSGESLARLRQATFAHGAAYRFACDAPALVVSYHPSRQNTQTGRLTAAMMDDVLLTVRRLLEEGAEPQPAVAPAGPPRPGTPGLRPPG